MTKILSFVFISMVVLPLSAICVEAQTTSSRQWEVLDLKFDVKSPCETPVDVEFIGTFMNSNGDKLEVPVFYNGNNQYVLRFTAPKSGQWTYVTRSPLPELDGKHGELKTQPANERWFGGVVLDPNNSKGFRYKSGKTYYPIAFESDWLFAFDAENPDDTPVTRKFIESLAANGFNQVVMNVFAYDVNWKKDEKLDSKFEYESPKVFPFAGDNSDPDHSKLDFEYFQRLDRVIDYLDQKGIAAHLMIYVWNKQVNWPDADSDEDNRYFDYVVSRYQAYPNLIWDISKEALGYGHNDVN